VIGMVVEKFVLQLEAQLADRNVTIELSDPAKAMAGRAWLRRADGRAADGALIQEHVKKPLADEVLFGKLKGGGHVRVDRRRGGGQEEALASSFRKARCSRSPKRTSQSVPSVRVRPKKGDGSGDAGPKPLVNV
jgi:ATP-dependent Clp protease ATP-binding subunit ClpA